MPVTLIHQILFLFVIAGSQYKKLCWKLDQMGAVGETALHVCLLNATSIHADLAKRLLKIYPNLINDIYISDEYYGNTSFSFTFPDHTYIIAYMDIVGVTSRRPHLSS